MHVLGCSVYEYAVNVYEKVNTVVPRAWSPQFAVAAYERPVPCFGFGNYAAADAGRASHSEVSGVFETIPDIEKVGESFCRIGA